MAKVERVSDLVSAKKANKRERVRMQRQIRALLSEVNEQRLLESPEFSEMLKYLMDVSLYYRRFLEGPFLWEAIPPRTCTQEEDPTKWAAEGEAILQKKRWRRTYLEWMRHYDVAHEAILRKIKEDASLIATVDTQIKRRGRPRKNRATFLAHAVKNLSWQQYSAAAYLLAMAFVGGFSGVLSQKGVRRLVAFLPELEEAILEWGGIPPWWKKRAPSEEHELLEEGEPDPLEDLVPKSKRAIPTIKRDRAVSKRYDNLLQGPLDRRPMSLLSSISGVHRVFSIFRTKVADPWNAGQSLSTRLRDFMFRRKRMRNTYHIWSPLDATSVVIRPEDIVIIEGADVAKQDLKKKREVKGKKALVKEQQEFITALARKRLRFADPVDHCLALSTPVATEAFLSFYDYFYRERRYAGARRRSRPWMLWQASLRKRKRRRGRPRKKVLGLFASEDAEIDPVENASNMGNWPRVIQDDVEYDLEDFREYFLSTGRKPVKIVLSKRKRIALEHSILLDLVPKIQSMGWAIYSGFYYITKIKYLADYQLVRYWRHLRRTVKRGNKYTPKAIYRRAVRAAQFRVYGPGFPSQRAEAVSLDTKDHIIRYKEWLSAEKRAHSFSAPSHKIFWYGGR